MSARRILAEAVGILVGALAPVAIVELWLLQLVADLAADVVKHEPDPERGPGTHWKVDGRPKTGFRSRKAAEQHAREIRGRGGPELHPYRCDHECSGWHLSSSPRRRDQA